MSSLVRRLRGSSSQPRGSVTASTTAPCSLSTTHMFLIEVIAFGEVYAVPVTKATPVTVVLRYVMEAAVSEEEAARMGNIEATLYFKERPLPLDTVMGKLPKGAVLHLHSSLSTTSSVLRDRRQNAVAMLPQDRHRYAQTTVTMQPVLKDGNGAREGSGSTTGGLSSEGRGSPSLERNSGIPMELPVYDVDTATAAIGGAAPRMMMLAPMMVPMRSSYAAPAIMPYYCCMPVGAAGSGIRMLGPQSRTVSAQCLSASRRRDSAVEFANSYRFPPNENPLNATGAFEGGTAATANSLHFSGPVTRRCSVLSDDRYVVVYLRLPRDRAAAGMSAAALSSDSNIEVAEVEPKEVPMDELLNTTFSTVATSKSQAPCTYSYRRLRVRKDFPVGTLRELCAVEKNYRLHLAHKEIVDEAQSFAELEVPANAVFYFKAAPGQKDSPMQRPRTLTRERLQEHLKAGAAAVGNSGALMSLGSSARSPSHIDAARPSLDRSLPSPEATPIRSHVEPRCSAKSGQRRRSGSAASTTSSQSIRERIEAFNEGTVRNPNTTEEEEAGVTAGVGDAAPHRYIIEGRETIITSAVATEEARRAAEAAARKAEAEAEAEAAEAAEAAYAARRPSSPLFKRGSVGQPEVLPLEREEDIDVDVDDVPGTQPDAAERLTSPDPKPSASSSAIASPALIATTTNAAAVGKKPKKGKSPGERKKAFRWMRRSSPAASEIQQQRGPHPARVKRERKLHRKRMQNSTEKSANTAAAASSPEPDLPKEVDNAAADAAAASMSTAGATPAPVMPSDAAAAGATTRHEESATSSRRSSRTSSVASSWKASFQRLAGRTSAEKKKEVKARSRSASASKAATTQLAPATASEKMLLAMKQKSERVSGTRAQLAAAENDSKRPTPTKEKAEQLPVEANSDTSAQATAAANKARRSGTAAPSASSPSYSERRQQSAHAVPHQPISFLGADPSQKPLQEQRRAITIPGPGATYTASTLEEVSATFGPAALSNTCVPSPRNSPSPVSILVSPSLEQQRRRESTSSAEATKMTEANVNDHRRGAANATPESRAATPDFSVESTGSCNRLRITIKDPEDAARFHYGVPVEPDCPVGVLREWITAMQRPSTETGKIPPSLRDVDRFGVFAGDTYLRDESTITFGNATGGRNDVVFSIRRRF